MAKERLASKYSEDGVGSTKLYSSNAADASNLSVFGNAAEVSPFQSSCQPGFPSLFISSLTK